jgi:5-methylcytosine-specific restriction endonuclease McrA
VPSASLFCSDLCKDEAKYVRYYREKIADGTAERPDIREALRIRLAHILAGGYDARGRATSDEIRQAVIARDAGRCRSCGGIGTEVDHIRGNSSELDNLQLLCADCHREKTIRSLQRISPEEQPELLAKAEALDDRATADAPLRFCDHSDWQTAWRSIKSARLSAVRS